MALDGLIKDVQGLNRDVLFSILHKKGFLSAGQDLREEYDPLSREGHISVGLAGSQGYAQDFLSIATSDIFRDENQGPLRGLTLEMALSTDFSHEEGWAEVKVALETKDQPWLEMGPIDLKGYRNGGWFQADFVLPKPLEYDEIRRIRVIPNSRGKLGGRMHLKAILFRDILFDWSITSVTPALDRRIQFREVFEFCSKQNLYKILVVFSRPNGVERDWDGLQGSKGPFEVRMVQTHGTGEGVEADKPMLELARISFDHDIRRAQERYGSEEGGSPKAASGAFNIGSIKAGLNSAETGKQAGGKGDFQQFDLVLLQGKYRFDEFLVQLHLVARTIKLNGFLVVWDTGWPAVRVCMDHFQKNRNREFRLVSGRKDEKSFMVFQKMEYLDPRDWDHFIQF